MRKWDLRFAGTKTERIERFLQQLEENMGLAGLSERKKMSALSHVFTGVATEWYRNNEEDWQGWEDF